MAAGSTVIAARWPDPAYLSRYMRAFHRFPVAILLAGAPCMAVMAQQVDFTIWKGDAVVGGITALRKHAGENAIYAVSSHSELDIVMKQVVRSTMGMEYRSGRPYSCFTSFHLNGSLRDSSNMRARGGGLECFIHPKDRFSLTGTSPWSTSRMYFEEPVGQASVFVESVLRECAMRCIGEGRYVVELPGNRSNTYRYVGGALQEVEVDRPLMKLVFRRA